MNAMPSHLDLRCYELRCEGTDCRYIFKETLRRLDATDQVDCPRCSIAMNLKATKRDGDLRKEIDNARQRDANSFGEKPSAAGSPGVSV